MTKIIFQGGVNPEPFTQVRTNSFGLDTSVFCTLARLSHSKCIADAIGIYKSLRHGEQIKGEHYSTYARDDIPAEWRYKNSSMVQQIVVVAESGHAFGDFQLLADTYRAEVGDSEVDELSAVYGCNGYEPSVKETHTVLFAREAIQ